MHLPSVLFDSPVFFCKMVAPDLFTFYLSSLPGLLVDGGLALEREGFQKG